MTEDNKAENNKAEKKPRQAAKKIVNKDAQNTAANKPAVKSSIPSAEIRKIALIRVRGDIHLKRDIRDTMQMLGLYKKHSCVILDSTKSNMGMLNKVKDYITYGEINDECIKLLNEKRLEKTADGTPKKTFRLHPPRGGYEKNGTKKTFKEKGALGNRLDKINDLIKRMI